ncbi:hypothetical protein A8L34_05610 [Bacillus sp. FJAT-27264]|nr:hypothetical protein A8L34_05610 [Bacillus sp. FJAT-27264]
MRTVQLWVGDFLGVHGGIQRREGTNHSNSWIINGVCQDQPGIIFSNLWIFHNYKLDNEKLHFTGEGMGITGMASCYSYALLL